MSKKVQFGYTGKAKSKGYGPKRNGKNLTNGGFTGPRVSFNNISEERWNAIDWSK